VRSTVTPDALRRAIKPPSTPPAEPTQTAIEVPNGNPLDATTAPHTVGPEVVAFNPPPPAPWAGWPADWDTPSWYGGLMGHLSSCSDTAFACLDLNSSVLATMPVYRTGASGEPLPPVEWMRNPDADVYASWHDFAKQLFWSYQLGEAFVLCTARYAASSGAWPARFHMVEPWTVEVEFVGGLRRYRIDGRPVPEGDLLHIRYASTPSDPRGHGPLEAGRCRLVAANVLCRYATELARQGGVPAFVITHPDELTAPQISSLQQQWYASRVAALGLPAVMSGGITIEALQISPRDMSLIELQQFNEQRIAVLLGVPPTIVALPSGEGSMVYNNVQGIYDYHWRAFLRPRAQAVMSALSQWALPRGQGAELNRDEYVRPALGERAQAYSTLHGIVDADGTTGMTAAEVRVLERFGAQNGIPTEVDVLTGGLP
jgi:hypothetical protein